MKNLSILLAVLLALAPFQAHGCGMAPAVAGDPAAAMSAHGDAGMDPTHDCCADEVPAEPPACDASGSCDHCLAGTAAVPVSAEPSVFAPFAYRDRLVVGALAPSHASPPFRPPAIIS